MCIKDHLVNALRTLECGRYEKVGSNQKYKIFILKFILFLQNIMEVMGFIAILVNCALIGLSGQVHRLLPDMTAIQTVLLIVALEVSYIYNNIV